MKGSFFVVFGDPYGTRTRVSTVKGWRPRPLDERAIALIDDANIRQVVSIIQT